MKYFDENNKIKNTENDEIVKSNLKDYYKFSYEKTVSSGIDVPNINTVNFMKCNGCKNFVVEHKDYSVVCFCQKGIAMDICNYHEQES